MKNLSNESSTIEQLQSENISLNEKISSLENQKAELTAKLNWFEEQFRLNQHRLFGRSSEKSVYSEQQTIFNEAEALSSVEPEVPEPTIEEIKYKRKKRQGQREDKIKDLPVETIEYKLPEENQVCDFCGGKLHEMSTEVRKELVVIPAQVKVVEHIQHVYGCRNCENNEINTPIVTAKMPAPAIPGSIASASAIAYVMVQKYLFGLPLYRQEQQWKQLDVEISRQTMANWVIIAAMRWLYLIYKRMHEILVQKDIICADETSLQVLNEPGRSASTKSYMWVYRTGRDGPPIILFEYQTTRAGKHPKKFLEGFKGYICTDGYDGYNGLSEVIRICCLSHARRKFDEALKAMPKSCRSKTCAAQVGLDFCNKLFNIEDEFKNSTAKERYEGRLNKSKPVLDEFYVWLKTQSRILTPKSTTGKGVRYCLNLWDKLTNYLLDGRLYCDNNITERTIKGFVVARKNFLFCNTQKGATASATVYSIIQTAKENNLKPFEYIKYLLEQLPNLNVKDQNILDTLLPWSESLPDYCKVPTKNI